MDGADLVRRVREEAGGPDLCFLGHCIGGEVGAARVADQSGRLLILSAVPGDPDGRTRHERSMAVLERLWAAGHPAPRYEAVIDLGNTLVIVQEAVPGRTPTRLTRGLTERLLQLQAERLEVMGGELPNAGPVPLYLIDDGPGFALHESLRTHSDRTRRLLVWIAGIAERYGDTLPGTDAVHYDYHPGNVLVHHDRPDEIAAIIDWDGAAAGHGGFDLVTTTFVAGIEWEPGVANRLWAEVGRLPDAVLLPSWAHLSLRLVDWAIRFRPEHLEHWLGIAERFE